MKKEAIKADLTQIDEKNEDLSDFATTTTDYRKINIDMQSNAFTNQSLQNPTQTVVQSLQNPRQVQEINKIGVHSHQSINITVEKDKSTPTEKKEEKYEESKESLLKQESQNEYGKSKQYNQYYAWFCLSILVCICISNTWSRSILSSMNGFGVEGQKDDKDYNIALAIDGYNPTNYGILVGPAFNILNGIIVLFTGGLTDKVNRRNMICIACLLWGFVTFLNSFCTTFFELLILRMLLGTFMAFFGPALYSLIADIFPVDQRTNAFSVYSILTVIGDTISALSINLISLTGWKGAFQVCGSFGIATALLGLFTVDEPEREDEDQQNAKDIKSETGHDAQFEFSMNNYSNQFQTEQSQLFEIKQLSPSKLQSENSEKQMKEQQENNESNMINEFLISFKQILANQTACLLLIGSSFKVWQTITMAFYLSMYFKVYPENDKEFSYYNAMGVFFCSILTNFITMGINKCFEQYDMTIPLIIFFKSLVDIPCCALVFMNQNNFQLSMIGLLLEYLLAKGWSSPVIQMLQTVVDKQYRGTSVAVFFFSQSMIASLTSSVIGFLIEKYQLNAEKTPKQLGYLLTISTCLPCLISLPCFLFAGFGYRKIKQEQRRKLESKDEDESRAQKEENEQLKAEAQFDKFGARDIDNIMVHQYSVNFKRLAKTDQELSFSKIKDKTLQRFDRYMLFKRYKKDRTFL